MNRTGHIRLLHPVPSGFCPLRLLVLIALAGAPAEGAAQAPHPRKTGYVQLGQVRMYYHLYGISAGSLTEGQTIPAGWSLSVPHAIGGSMIAPMGRSGTKPLRTGSGFSRGSSELLTPLRL